MGFWLFSTARPLMEKMRGLQIIKFFQKKLSALCSFRSNQSQYAYNQFLDVVNRGIIVQEETKGPILRPRRYSDCLSEKSVFLKRSEKLEEVTGVKDVAQDVEQVANWLLFTDGMYPGMVLEKQETEFSSAMTDSSAFGYHLFCPLS